ERVELEPRLHSRVLHHPRDLECHRTSRARDVRARGAAISRTPAASGRQDVDHAYAATAHHVAEADACVRHLTLAGLAAQLQRRLPDLREPGRTAGVAAGDEA